MTTDLTRTLLEDIVQWWPILEDVQESLYHSGSTGRVSLSGVRSSDPDSPPMIAVLRLADIHAVRLHVELLAHEWGWRNGDGPYHLYLFSRWAWASRHMPAEHADRLAYIHTKVQRLVKEGPLPTDRICPSCGESQLMETREGQYWCDTCELVRDDTELETLIRWRASSVPRVTAHEAARLLGLKASTVRRRAADRGLAYVEEAGRRLYSIHELM